MDGRVIRFAFKLVICLFFAGAAAAAYFAWRTGDPVYTAREWLSPGKFHQHDRLIRVIAAQHKLDPMLVKAVVWRESGFNSHKFGAAGERGLMQVTETAAKEWAAEEKIRNFRVEELFDPKVNISAGSWYLARALQRWRHQRDPIPFALAEYNAGASRAQRWAGGRDVVIPPSRFRQNIDFPTTRRYVETVINRYRYYRKRGRL